MTHTLLGSAAGAQPWKSIVAGRRSQGVPKNWGGGIFLEPTSPTVMNLLVDCMWLFMKKKVGKKKVIDDDDDDDDDDEKEILMLFANAW